MKKILSFTLLLAMLFSLAACGDPTDPDTESGSTAQSAAATSSGVSDETDTTDTAADGSTEDPAEAEPVDNKMLACDQYGERIVLYDLNLIEKGDDLDDAEIWSMDSGYCADMKYREDTVFGDVIITAGSPTSGIYAYPSKEVIWSTDESGGNPHAVEILPDGDIVIANSTGSIRHFNVSAIRQDKDAEVEYDDYELEDAHGLLYDPEYEVLWALGNYDLTAYLIRGDWELVELSNMSAKLPEGCQGGHDLSADMTDTRYLYITGQSAVRYDKEEGTFDFKFNQYAKLAHTSEKGLSNNKANNFFYIICDGQGNEDKEWGDLNIAAWCSDTIHFCYWKTEYFMYDQEYTSSTSAFYKTRAFVGSYQ